MYIITVQDIYNNTEVHKYKSLDDIKTLVHRKLYNERFKGIKVDTRQLMPMLHYLYPFPMYKITRLERTKSKCQKLK